MNLATDYVITVFLFTSVCEKRVYELRTETLLSSLGAEY